MRESPPATGGNPLDFSTKGPEPTAGSDMVDALRNVGIVPVIVIEDPAHAVRLARALIEGGLPCAEVTFRTKAAREALARMAEAYPEMLVGAGTVLTPRQVDEAIAAGAKFIVSPGIDTAVVDRCLEVDIPVFPGVCTPTEIALGLGRGLTTLKFFPAEPAGGIPYLTAISAPYPMVEFIPTGGINAGLLSEYLGLRQVVACGGSWMVSPQWLKNQDFDRIRSEVEKAVQAVDATKPKTD